MKRIVLLAFILTVFYGACSSTPQKGEFCAYRKGGESNYINCIVHEHFDLLKSCYQVSAAAKTFEELKITFRFKVAADGKVIEVRPRAEARHAEMAKCQQAEFLKMQFPELGKNEISEGEYIFWVRAIVN